MVQKSQEHRLYLCACDGSRSPDWSEQAGVHFRIDLNILRICSKICLKRLNTKVEFKYLIYPSLPPTKKHPEFDVYYSCAYSRSIIASLCNHKISTFIFACFLKIIQIALDGINLIETCFSCPTLCWALFATAKKMGNHHRQKND